MTNESWRAAEHRTLARLVEGSAIVRVLDRSAVRVERAIRSSWIYEWAHVRLAAAAALGRDEQWRRLGTMLITAVVVHLVLLFARHPETGWRALVIPAVVAAQGILLLIMPKGGRDS